MNDNSLEIKIKGNDEHYEETLKGVEGKTKKTFSEIDKKQADLVAGADKLAYNAQIEQYQAGLKTLLGSAEKANETLGNLKEFASTTPFELTDLANASTTLLAFGENVDDLMPDLKMLGDISLGNKEKFSSLALVFGQVKSQGRLMGQDLLQMINAGFNPLLVISEKTGESMDSLKDKMSKGQITFEMVADAMKTATSQGGQFYNALEEQSKKLQGQFSTLKDSASEFAGEVSEDLSEYLTNTVLPALIEKMETLKEMWEDGSLQKWLGGAAAAATVLGVAIAAIKLGGLISDIKQLRDGVKSFTAATKLGTTAQKAFNAAQNLNVWIKLAAAIVAVVGALWSYSKVAGIAGEETEDLNTKLERSRAEYDEAVDAINKEKNEKLAELEVTTSLKDKLYELEEQLKSNTLTEEQAAEKREELNGVANRLNEIIPGIVENIKDENGQLVIQRKEIDSLTDSYANLITTKATADAYQAILTKTKAKRLESELLMDEKRDALTDYIKEEYAVHQATNKNAAGGEVMTPWAFGQEWIKNNPNDAYAEELRTATEEFEKDLKKEERVLEEFNDAILEADKAQAEYAKKTKGYVKETAGGTTETLKTETGKQKTILSQAQKELLDIVEQAHKLGIMSDKDYYNALSLIRDKFFEVGSDDWQKYTDDIANYYTDTLKKLKDKMEQFSQKLQDDTHKTYSTITLYEGETPKTWTTLADMGYQNNKLEEQLELLKKIKEKRKEIPKVAMEELRQMSQDEAIEFLKTMLNQSDAEWEKWASGIEENKRLADEYAKETYATEIDENQELINKFKEQWSELPDEFYEVGQDCAEQYGAGLKNALEGLYAEARAGIMSMFSSPPAGVVMSGVSGMGVGSSTTYTDNRTTNIYANGTSPHAIAEATKQNDIYQQHTSTFGG